MFNFSKNALAGANRMRASSGLNVSLPNWTVAWGGGYLLIVKD